MVKCILCVLFLASGAKAEEGYAWPMEAKPALTSTFGEYRKGGRLHAAIDLKTWGKEGFPMVAVGDGFIWRVRTSPWGYGRAVYIQLRDGRFAVYAHLSGFSDQITTFVEEEQERRGTYSVNLIFKEDQLPVKRGETVGFSGSTGIGVPHMHFELRDADNRPMNPLTKGFDVVDTHPPTLKSVALIPLDAGSRVNGALEPYVLGLRWSAKQKAFLAAERVSIEGRVGVALDASDRADAALFDRLSPYRIQLLVDGREVFRTTYTVFDYYTTVYQGELAWNLSLIQKGLGRFHNLYRIPGNRLPFYGAYQPGDGILHGGVPVTEAGVALADGVRRLEVVAEDAKGNRSEARLEVLVNRQPEVLEAHVVKAADSVRVSARVSDDDPVQVLFEGSDDDGQNWRLIQRVGLEKSGRVQGILPSGKDRLYRVRARDPHGQEAFQTCGIVKAVATSGLMFVCEPFFYAEFAVIRIQSDRILGIAPRVRARWPGGREGGVAVRQTLLKTYEAVVVFDKRTSGQIDVEVSGVGQSGEVGQESLVLVQHRVDQKTGGVVRSPDGLAAARFKPNGVYRTLFGRVEAVEGEGLQVYRFMPDDVPFRIRLGFQPARIVLTYPEAFDRPEKLGVYRQKGETWEFLDNQLDREGRTVSAEVTHFSTYTLRVDESPPEVEDLMPKGVVRDRRPRLVATIRDSMSGIGRETDISMRLDEKTVIIFEYDPEEDRIVGRPKQALEPGPHRLRVVVRDMCGNETVRERAFTVQ